MSWRPDPAFAALVAAPILALVGGSWRVEVRHQSRWRSLVDSKTPFLFLLWHEVLLPLLWLHRQQAVAIVVSDSQDGRYLHALAARLGYQSVVGSSSRGGVRALLGAVRTLQAGVPVAFTPDGPRGPRRELKPGVLAAAQRSGAAILPIHAVVKSAWRLNSWDRFVIPKPLARVRIGYGEPFLVREGEAGIDEGAALARGRLVALEEELQW